MRDMTEGSIRVHLVRYALPMILGNIFQLTYNAVDSVIIGKSLGEDALAAVCTANPVMTIMVLGASGMGIGASVILGKLYGARDYERFRREFSTAGILGIGLSLLIFILGVWMSPGILRLIHTPPEALDMGVLYLRIIFIGFLFTFQYNILSHAMRSTGDSRTPVVFLAVSCVLNVILDLVLICGFHLGVAGAAWATTAAEGISVVLCLVWIKRKIPLLCLKREEVVVDGALLLETVKNGCLTALQQAAQPVGKVLIQSTINLQGVTAIDAFNAVCRVDDFACIPAQSIGSGIMTCTAQNRGAGKKDRVHQTLRDGLGVALAYFPLICAVTLLFKKPLMIFLTPAGSEEMIRMGTDYLAVKAWLFVLPCITNAIQGYFRGLGKMAVVLLATLTQISIRTVCVTFWVPVMGITGEAWACMAGWSCQLLLEGTLLVIMRRREKTAL